MSLGQAHLPREQAGTLPQQTVLFLRQRVMSPGQATPRQLRQSGTQKYSGLSMLPRQTMLSPSQITVSQASASHNNNSQANSQAGNSCNSNSQAGNAPLADSTVSQPDSKVSQLVNKGFPSP